MDTPRLMGVAPVTDVVRADGMLRLNYLVDDPVLASACAVAAANSLWSGFPVRRGFSASGTIAKLDCGPSDALGEFGGYGPDGGRGEFDAAGLAGQTLAARRRARAARTAASSYVSPRAMASSASRTFFMVSGSARASIVISSPSSSSGEMSTAAG